MASSYIQVESVLYIFQRDYVNCVDQEVHYRGSGLNKWQLISNLLTLVDTLII